MNKLTQKRLKETFHYDKNTGLFTYINPPGKKMNIGDVAGAINDKGYVIIGVNYKYYGAHRLAFLYVNGYLPECQIDHKDRIRHHNWWDNLREVTQTCNSRNCNINKNNTSGITGVYFNKVFNKWVAAITIRSKTIYIGGYVDIEDAVRARYEAEIKFGFLDCKLNSPAKQYLDKLKMLKQQ